MKIAVIEHRLKYFHGTELNNLISELKTKFNNLNLEAHIAQSIEEFREKHGSLKNYDGVILHPGINQQKKAVETIKKHPNLKIGFITEQIVDYAIMDETGEALSLIDNYTVMLHNYNEAAIYNMFCLDTLKIAAIFPCVSKINCPNYSGDSRRYQTGFQKCNIEMEIFNNATKFIKKFKKEKNYECVISVFCCDEHINQQMLYIKEIKKTFPDLKIVAQIFDLSLYHYIIMGDDNTPEYTPIKKFLEINKIDFYAYRSCGGEIRKLLKKEIPRSVKL